MIGHGQHRTIGDQAALVTLRRPHQGELAQACDQSAQMQLRWRGWRLRLGAPGRSEPGDHAGIDGVGLLLQAHAFGEAPHRPRVHNRHRQPLGPQQRKEDPHVGRADRFDRSLKAQSDQHEHDVERDGSPRQS